MGQGPMTGGGRGFCAMPYRAYGPYGYGMRHLRSTFGDHSSYGRPFDGPIFGAGRGGLPWGGGRGRVLVAGEGSVVGDNKKIVVAWGPSMEPNPLTPLGEKGDLPTGRHG